MLKRLAAVIGGVAALVWARNKAKQQQAEQELWTAATDDVSSPAAPVPPATTPAPAEAAGDEKPSA